MILELVGGVGSLVIVFAACVLTVRGVDWLRDHL